MTLGFVTFPPRKPSEARSLHPDESQTLEPAFPPGPAPPNSLPSHCPRVPPGCHPVAPHLGSHTQLSGCPQAPCGITPVPSLCTKYSLAVAALLALSRTRDSLTCACYWTLNNFLSPLHCYFLSCTVTFLSSLTPVLRGLEPCL